MADKYRCERCGEIILESDLDWDEWDEHHPYGEGYATEHWAEPCCPFCGSKRVEEYYGEDEEEEEETKCLKR